MRRFGLLGLVLLGSCSPVRISHVDDAIVLHGSDTDAKTTCVLNHRPEGDDARQRRRNDKRGGGEDRVDLAETYLFRACEAEFNGQTKVADGYREAARALVDDLTQDTPRWSPRAPAVNVNTERGLTGALADLYDAQTAAFTAAERYRAAQCDRPSDKTNADLCDTRRADVDDAIIKMQNLLRLVVEISALATRVTPMRSRWDGVTACTGGRKKGETKDCSNELNVFLGK